ncbi:hypothetical protein AB0E25_04535, partial [Streptomyces bobili]|uniref:hypothetical protein n=1 Tax=Streptomyces bobili TaxID=67280 RepID=UPI00346967AE
LDEARLPRRTRHMDLAGPCAAWLTPAFGRARGSRRPTVGAEPNRAVADRRAAALRLAASCRPCTSAHPRRPLECVRWLPAMHSRGSPRPPPSAAAVPRRVPDSQRPRLTGFPSPPPFPSAIAPGG